MLGSITGTEEGISLKTRQASLSQSSLLKNGEIISNQMEYNLLMRDIETEILPFQRENGIATSVSYVCI